MKKLMAIIALVVLATVANADTVRIVKVKKVGKKNVTVTNVVDALEYFAGVAKKNGAGLWNKVNNQRGHIESLRTPETIDQVDVLLSRARFYVNRFDTLNIDGKAVKTATLFPRCYANWPESCKADEAVNLVREAMAEEDSQIAKEMSVMAGRYDKMFKHGAIEAEEIARVAIPSIKRKIRKEGLSFVSKDGVNPIQVRLDHLIAALNAYRIEGLDAALRECGLDYGLSFEKLLRSEQDIEKLKRKVLDGTVEFSSAKEKLRTHLGVEQYNELVDLYNGQE